MLSEAAARIALLVLPRNMRRFLRQAGAVYSMGLHSDHVRFLSMQTSTAMPSMRSMPTVALLAIAAN